MNKLSRYTITIACLTFLFLTSVVPILASDGARADPAGDFDYYITGESTVCIVGYHGAGGDIVIPMEIEGKSVVSIAAYAFQYQNSIKSVSIPDNVTNIGHHAFFTCTALTSVVLPDGMANLYEGTFAYCSALKTVTIPDSVTSIASWVFTQCPLTSIEIPQNVTEIGAYAFADTHLILLSISMNLTYIDPSAFHAITTLGDIEVNISNPVYSSIDGVLCSEDGTILMQFPCGRSGAYVVPSTVTTVADYAFDYAVHLESVSMPDSVTSLGMSAFEHCSSLAHVKLPENITVIRFNAFAYCSSLQDIPIPSNVTVIESGAFFSCTSLENVTLGGKVTTVHTSSFFGCTCLTAVNIGPCVSLIMDSAFGSCSSLTSITFLGLTAPSTQTDWIAGTSPELRGHASINSNFPAPLYFFNGLQMGSYLEGIPTAPRTLNAVAGDNQVTLSWATPIDYGNHPITGYKVYRTYSELNDYILIGSTTGVTFTDSGVLNGDSYLYKVSAVNSDGEGPRSGLASATPHELYPVPNLTLHSSAKGYSIPVPSGWTVEDNRVVSGQTFDTVISGPVRDGFMVNVLVFSGYDRSIVDAQQYLTREIDEFVAEASGLSNGFVETEFPVSIEVSGRPGIMLGYELMSYGVHQWIVAVVDVEHQHVWLMSFASSLSSRAEFDATFDAMIDGFVITSVPYPPLFDLTPQNILLILLAVILIIAAIVALLSYKVLRRKCPRCLRWYSKREPGCPYCLQQATEINTFCITCGKKVEPGTPSCPYCGRTSFTTTTKVITPSEEKGTKIATYAFASFGGALSGWGFIEFLRNGAWLALAIGLVLSAIASVMWYRQGR